MSKLTQIVLKNILENLIKDEKFVQSLAQSMMRIFEVSLPSPGTSNPFQNVVNQIVEYCEGQTNELNSNIPGLRKNLIAMLEDKEFLAFARLLKMLKDLFNYSDTRIMNYLKKLKFQTKFNEGLDSPWIDVRETAKAVRQGLDPRRMKIFTGLSYEQKCLLRGFSPEEINLMSNFSPRGLNILSRFTHLSQRHRVMILGLREEESQVFRDLGFRRFRFLLNIQAEERNTFLELSRNERRAMSHSSEEVTRFFQNHGVDDEDRRDLLNAILEMSSEELQALRELFDVDTDLLEGLTEDAVDLAGCIHDLSREERDRYFNLGRTEFDVLNNLSKDQRRVIMRFEGQVPSFKQVLDVANSLDPRQRDLILSLRQREIRIIVGTEGTSILSQVENISFNDPDIIRGLSILPVEEENAISDLTREQRLVLAKAYNLGHDGLYMMYQLGPELTRQVFVSFFNNGKTHKQLNVMQTALTNKLKNVQKERSKSSIYLDKTEINELFRIMNHKTAILLLNLSWKGIDLIKRMAYLNDKAIDIVERLSARGLSILTKNDKLTESEILELGSLEGREGQVLMNLNREQRKYLSSKRNLFRFHPLLFNDQERQVIRNLSKPARRVFSRIIRLSEREHNQDGNGSGIGRVFLSKMNPMELDLFSILTVNEVCLLSSFMVWHVEEDLIFTLLGTHFEPSSHGRTQQLRTLIGNIASHTSFFNCDIFELFASTIECLRLSNTLTDDWVNTIASLTENIHGMDVSMILKFRLLNASIRDSRSLESLFVPQITNDQRNIYPVWNIGEIHTREDLMFLRWIFSQPFNLNEGIFHNFAVVTLFRLAVTMTGQELDILLSESTSLLDGIQHDRVVKSFRTILAANDYLLASSFFFPVGRAINSPEISASVFRSLALTLTPDDCFHLFASPINHIILEEISSTSLLLGYRSILSDLRFENPNVLEVSIYYNCGDPLPLLERLEEAQIWELFKERTHLLLQLLARNRQIKLLELCESVGKLNQLIKSNRVSILKALIKDLTSHKMCCPTGLQEVSDIIRYFAYTDSFIGREIYIEAIADYVVNLQARVSMEELKVILESLVTEDASFNDFMHALRYRVTSDLYLFLQNDRDRCCSVSRKKRHVDMTCVDSKNAKEVTSEEENRIIEKTFYATMAETQSEHLELYNELLEYSKKVFQGKRINYEVERSLLLKIKNLPLETMDQRIVDIIERIQDRSKDQNGIERILKQSGIVQRINRAANAAGFLFTVFLVGKHLVHGDLDNLGYDALNLWVMPKIGDIITDKLADLAERYDSVIAKGLGPVIGAGVGNLAAFVGLVQGLRERASAVDPVDVKLADLNIISNSIFIAANVPAVATRILSSFGTEISVVGELAGPLGMALSVGIVITSYLISLSLEVEKVEEHIRLSSQEKRSLYWRFFWDESIPQNLRVDLEAKNLYTHYIEHYLDRFKGKYHRIAVSLPRFLIMDKECIPNKGPRFKRRISRGTHYCIGCNLGEKNTSYVMDFSETAIASHPFRIDHKDHRSRLIPEKLKGYDVVCGPSTDDAEERDVNTNVAETCPPHSVYHDTKWNVRTKQLSLPFKSRDRCTNIVSFEKHGLSGSSRVLFYLAHDNASIVLSDRDSVDMIFYGEEISVAVNKITKPTRKVQENRYFFSQQLRNCSIHRKGHNFFYLKTKNFQCNLGDKTEQQHNVIVVRSNFEDSKNIHSIVGSENGQAIEAKFAEYVDGKGGGDTIHTTARTIVKGYFEDFIVGKCTILLPLNASDIGHIIATSRMSIYNKEGSPIRVDAHTVLITADNYLLTPIRISNITYKMTHAHIKKTLDEEIVLENELGIMRDIKIPNCTLVKQVSSSNYDIVLSETGRNIFYVDKNHHEFYWESDTNHSNLYLMKNLFVNVTISNANGILDFRDLEMGSRSVQEYFHWNRDGEIEISVRDLRVILLANRKDVTATFDGKEYFKVEDKKILRNYCSHSLRIVGRLKIDGTHLPGHLNCFEFDSNKILFLRLGKDLSIISGRQVLTILKYYSSVHRIWDLSVKSNDWIIEPEIFQKRADNPYKMVYYRNNDSALQIYHNQPHDKHYIGFLDFTDKSIEEFELTMKDRDVLLNFRNVTLVEIKNWKNYQPGRELMFAFKDVFISNEECVVSHCKPNNIVEDFAIGKARIEKWRFKRYSRSSEGQKVATNNAMRTSTWINCLVDAFVKPVQSVFQTLCNKLPTNYADSRGLHDEQHLHQFGFEFFHTTNVNLTLILLQNYLDKRYPLPKMQFTTLEEVLVNVMDLVEEYQRVVKRTVRRFDMKLKNLNLFQLYHDIARFVKKEEFNRISHVLYSAAEELYPREEEFLTNLNINIRQMFDQ